MRPSDMDDEFMALARQHIRMFLWSELQRYPGQPPQRILEIGPGRDQFVAGEGDTWDTLDIKPGCTYQHDITLPVPRLLWGQYDQILAMEVLEHTTDPFNAVLSIRQMLKHGGILLASAPMNFREHGPLPDCWRFTRHGWRVLLKDWDDVQLDVLMTPDRPLMPLHICVGARCNKTKIVHARDMSFPLEET